MAVGLQPPSPNTLKPKFKNTDFVDMISNVLGDFTFSRNQPLKADD
jgi:hypothetical protein